MEISATGSTVRAVLAIDGVLNAVSWSVQPPGPASPPAAAVAGLSIVASGITPEDGWVASGVWWPNMPGWRLVSGPSASNSIASVADSRALSFLPDGRLAVVTPKEVRITALDSAEVERHPLPESHRPQEVFVFNPDGTRLFAGGDVQPAWLVDTQTGQTRTLSKHSVGWARAAFADDHTLLFVDDATRARVDWESKRANPFRVEGFGSFYRLGAGGGRVAGLVANGVGVFDAGDGREVRRIPVRPGFDSLSLSPDGRWLAVRGAGLAIFDVATGSPLLEHGPDADFDTPLSQVKWSADGLRGAAVGGEAVYVWSLREPRWLVRFPHGLSGDYKSVALSPDGRRLAAGGSASPVIAYWPDIDAQLPPPHPE
jgi:WD40 repeat protein